MSLVGNLEDLGFGDILQILCLRCKSAVPFLRGGGREGLITLRISRIRRHQVLFIKNRRYRSAGYFSIPGGTGYGKSASRTPPAWGRRCL